GGAGAFARIIAFLFLGRGGRARRGASGRAREKNSRAAQGTFRAEGFMILPYTVRLLCLCLASFFLLHAALGLAVALAAPGALKLAEKMRARPAARFLFFLRVLPALLAAIVVLGLTVPSYMWLEPQSAEESVGLACCAAALMGAAVWCVSI